MQVDSYRNDNRLLPGKEELNQIIGAEVYHPVASGKEAVHYPKFDTMIALLSHLGLELSVFTDDGLDIYDIINYGQKLLDQIVIKLLDRELKDDGIRLLQQAHDYLSEEDEPEKSDLIFVFGSKTNLRPKKAAELFEAGIASVIMVSGGKPIYSNRGEEPEAERYRFSAETGVPSSAIITEPLSITVPDNVRRSLGILDNLKHEYQRIALVNSPYSQRRGWAVFKKHVPDTVTIYRVNCDTNMQYSRDRRYIDEAAIRVVLNEFIKMRASVVYNTA
jgi:uncharacterized SAM-binding protein YcdF (DUF218 family)